MFGDFNNGSKKKGKLSSMPYDKSKSFLSRMKNAVENYAPTWMQTFVSSEHVQNEDNEQTEGYEVSQVQQSNHKKENGRIVDSGFSGYGTGERSKRSVETGVDRTISQENKHLNTYDAPVSRTFQNEKYDNVNDQIPSFSPNKPKRKRQDGHKDAFLEVHSRPPLKRIALSKEADDYEDEEDEDDDDGNSSIANDCLINNYQSQKLPSKHQTISTQTPPKLLHRAQSKSGSLPPLNKTPSSLKSSHSRRLPSRVFMSNRGRSFIPSSTPSMPSQPTTPLYSKNEPPNPMMSPFYNRPIVYGGAMAYQSHSANKYRSGSGNSMQHNSRNKSEGSQHDQATQKQSHQLPSLVYDASLYKRMTVPLKTQGPPVKHLQAPTPSSYSITEPTHSTMGKMRREREKRHETRRKDAVVEEDFVPQDTQQHLSGIKLPPINFQTSTLLPSPPSSSAIPKAPQQPSSSKAATTAAKTFNPTNPPSGAKPLRSSGTVKAARKYFFHEPMHLSTVATTNNKKQAGAFESFSFKSPMRHSCKHQASFSTPVNFEAARKRPPQGYKTPSAGLQLKQGSVLDALNKPPAASPAAITKATPATMATPMAKSTPATTATLASKDAATPVAAVLSTKPPLSALFASSTKKWICPTCMVDNKEHVMVCPCCETAKPAPAKATKTLFSSPFTQASPLATAPSILKPTPSQKVVPLSELFKASSAGTWKCPTCLVSNKTSDAICPCCNEPKPPTKAVPPAVATSASTQLPSSTLTASTPFSSSSSSSSVFNTTTTTTTTASQVVLNAGGGFKLSFPTSSSNSSSSNNTSSNANPFNATPFSNTPFNTASFGATNKADSSAPAAAVPAAPAAAGGFKPSSSAILNSNLPSFSSQFNTPAFSTPNNFGGFKFGATASQSLPTTAATQITTSAPPTITTTTSSFFNIALSSITPSSSAIHTTTSALSFAPSATSAPVFSFGGMSKSASSSSLPFGAATSTSSFGSATNNLPAFGAPASTTSILAATTTTVPFGATAASNSASKGFFGSSSTTNTTISPVSSSTSAFQLGSFATNATQAGFSVTTTTTPATTVSSMFGSAPNPLFGNTTTSLFGGNKNAASSLFPPSTTSTSSNNNNNNNNSQFSLFATTSATFPAPDLGITSQNNFLGAKSSSANQLSFAAPPTTQSTTNQDNTNNNSSNFQLFNNASFPTPSFNLTSTTTTNAASTTSNFFSNLSSNTPFQFGGNTAQSTTTNMFGSTTTSGVSSNQSNSLFQFGAKSTSQSGFSAPQQFAFSMGKSNNKRAFTAGTMNSETDNKKASMIPSGTFSFGGTNSSNNNNTAFNTNQGLSFGAASTTTSAPMFQPTQASTFAFGQQNQPQQQQQQQQQQTTFQFGGQQPQQQQNSVFSFGQQQQAATQQQSTFNFGQQQQPQQSSVVAFGQQNQPGALSFSQVPNFNFTGNANTPNTVFSASSSTPIAGRSFKKATRRMKK